MALGLPCCSVVPRACCVLLLLHPCTYVRGCCVRNYDPWVAGGRMHGMTRCCMVQGPAQVACAPRALVSPQEKFGRSYDQLDTNEQKSVSWGGVRWDLPGS